MSGLAGNVARVTGAAIAAVLAGCATGPAAPERPEAPTLADVAATVLSRQDALAELWPGFWTDRRAFLVYDPDGDALLYTPTDPPPGYAPWGEVEVPAGLAGRLYRHDGVPPGLGEMFRVDYPVGAAEATAVNLRSSLSETLAVLFHESFHGFQRDRFAEFDREPEAGGWFVDPGAITPEFVARAVAEQRLLIEALQAGSEPELVRAARAYLAARRQRTAAAPGAARDMEDALERIEGSATWIETRALAILLDADDQRAGRYVREAYLAPPLKRLPGGLQQRVFRWRGYGTGAAIGLLLDRLEAPGWRESLARGATFPDLLAKAVAFDAVSSPQSMARRALAEVDIGEIRRRGESLWGSTDVPDIEDFLDAPMRVTLVLTEGRMREGRAQFTGDFFQLAGTVKWVQAQIYRIDAPGVSLVARERDVLVESDGETFRVSVAMRGPPDARPELPDAGRGAVPYEALRLRAPKFALDVAAPVQVRRGEREIEIVVADGAGAPGPRALQ